MENECVPYLSGWHGFHIVGRAQCAPAQCSIMGLRAHTVRPYGWDACFMPVTHYKPTCREWSRPFRDFVLDDLKIFVNRFDHVLAPFLMGASPPQT